MAIGVMRFKPLSMAQASPAYFGLQNLQQGLMQGLKMQQMAEQHRLAQNVSDLKKQALTQQLQDQATRRKMADQLFPVPEQVYLQQSGQTTAPLKPGDAAMQTEEQREQMAKQLIAHQLATEGKTEQAARLQGLFPESKTAYERNAIAMGLKPGTTEFQEAIEAMSTSRLIPTSIKQARYAAPLAQNIIDHAEDQGFIESAKKYSTAQGKGLEAWSGISGALGLGPTDPDYVKYQTFVNTTIPQLVAETRKLLGENASVRQTELLEQAVNPASWRAGPELVQSRWDELKTLHDFAQKQAMQSPLGTLAQETDVPRGAESAQKQQYTPEQRRQAAAILQRRRAGR